MGAAVFTTTYLITGANRGLGLALTTTFLARPSTTVVAAVRDPVAAEKGPFAKLKRGPGSNLVVIPFDAKSPATAVKKLTDRYGIRSLDVVIANAGIAPTEAYGPIAEADPVQLQEHISVNGIGPLLLFQAVQPLLLASTAPQPPKFLLLGSMQGSIGGMAQYPFPMGTYGASKALAHYIIRKIHYESEQDERTRELVVWAVDPGFMQTQLGNDGARWFGMEAAPVRVEDSTAFVVKSIDNATREKTGGHFPSYDGGEIIW